MNDTSMNYHAAHDGGRSFRKKIDNTWKNLTASISTSSRSSTATPTSSASTPRSGFLRDNSSAKSVSPTPSPVPVSTVSTVSTSQALKERRSSILNIRPRRSRDELSKEIDNKENPAPRPPLGSKSLLKLRVLAKDEKLRRNASADNLRSTGTTQQSSKPTARKRPEDNEEFPRSSKSLFRNRSFLKPTSVNKEQASNLVDSSTENIHQTNIRQQREIRQYLNRKGSTPSGSGSSRHDSDSSDTDMDDRESMSSICYTSSQSTAPSSTQSVRVQFVQKVEEIAAPTGQRSIRKVESTQQIRRSSTDSILCNPSATTSSSSRPRRRSTLGVSFDLDRLPSVLENSSAQALPPPLPRNSISTRSTRNVSKLAPLQYGPPTVLIPLTSISSEQRIHRLSRRSSSASVSPAPIPIKNARPIESPTTSTLTNPPKKRRSMPIIPSVPLTSTKNIIPPVPPLLIMKSDDLTVIPPELPPLPPFVVRTNRSIGRPRSQSSSLPRPTEVPPLDFKKKEVPSPSTSTSASGILPRTSKSETIRPQSLLSAMLVTTTSTTAVTQNGSRCSSGSVSGTAPIVKSRLESASQKRRVLKNEQTARRKSVSAIDGIPTVPVSLPSSASIKTTKSSPGVDTTIIEEEFAAFGARRSASEVLKTGPIEKGSRRGTIRRKSEGGDWKQFVNSDISISGRSVW